MAFTSAGTVSYFFRDKEFYKTVFRIMIMVALQNIVNYSVNMADNVMLGAYSQAALSGAACVNQAFFVVQSLISGVGGAMVILCSQYWGQRRTEPICRLGGVALKLSFCIGMLTFLVMALFPEQIVGLFTNDAEILREGVAYLRIIKYTMPLYCVSITLMDLLRSVETVRIAFVLSVISLLVNVVINYVLIFGNLGFSPMGVTGAAIGTLAARLVECVVLLLFMETKEQKLRLFHSDFLHVHKELRKDYARVSIPVILAGVAWSLATPVQAAILGQVSTDAIAANSVASTFYQYLKVIAMAMSSASVVVMGKLTGSGSKDEIKAGAHSLELLDILVGLVLAALLFVLRKPLLSFYSLSPAAMAMAGDLICLMCVIMVFMSYQAPVLFGLLRGAGDTKFSSWMNVVFVWGLSIPLALLSAFVFHWGVVSIVACIQCDQVLKCIPAAWRVHSSDNWIRKLTK